MNSNDKYRNTIVNYLFIFLAINYKSIIVTFITHIDSARYVLLFLSIAVIALNSNNFKLLLHGKPIVFWLAWCIYAVINYYFHPHTIDSLSVLSLYHKIFIPLIVLTVVVIEYERNSIDLFWICFITHAFFMVAGFYYDRGVLHRDLDEERVLGNAFAIISSFTIFYLALLNRLRKIPTPVFLVLAILIVYVLALSGTRKAFGAGLFMLAFWGLSQLDLRRIRSWIMVGAFIVVGFWGYNYLMENTFMGERMDYLEEQQEIFLPDDAPEILGIFGDRSMHYYYGWFHFLEHPIFGVGTAQARIEQGIYDDLYIHSEYMAQLVDGGLVGFILFILFFFGIIINVLRCLHNDSEIGRCMLGGVAALFFLYLTAWAWEFPQYFICLGVLVGFCRSHTIQEISDEVVDDKDIDIDNDEVDTTCSLYSS